MFRFDPDELKRAGPSAFVHRRTVRFHDIDAAGIVFYPRLFEYFHDAYVAFLEHLGSPLAPVLRARAWAAPIRHAEAEFLRPLSFGDEIDVALVQARLDRHRATVGFRIARPGGEVVAVGQSVHAFVDRERRRPIEIPPDIAAGFKSLAGG